MKQTILTLPTVMLIFSLGCQEEQKQTQKQTSTHYDKNSTTLITVYGKTDKRLKLQFYVNYRSKYNPNGKISPECQEASLHPITATQRGKLFHQSGAVITNQDEYNITFPIFNKLIQDKCKSTPIGLSVRITRLHEKHGLYSEVPIYTDTPIGAVEGSRGAVVGDRSFKVAYRAEALRKTGKVSEPPKYFRIRDGARVACYTKHYEKDGSSKEHTTFRCELPYKGNAEWRESIKDDTIHLDIIVDKNKSYFYPAFYKMEIGDKGHVEPFQEETLNIFDKMKRWFNLKENRR